MLVNNKLQKNSMQYFQSNITEKIDNNKNKFWQLLIFVIFMNILILPYSGSEKKIANHSLVQEKLHNIKESFIVLAKENDEEIAEIKEKSVTTIEKEIAWSKRYTMTAYNSEVAQCDASPCITANGFNVCEHGIEDTVAANFLKFGTEIRIPELFGDKIFIVRDRMNARYTNRVDVWLLHKDNAIDFGVKYPLIEVLK